MSKPVVSLPPSPPWYWPVDVTRYDRSPDLNEIEQAEPVIERQLDPRLGLVGGDRHRLRHPLREGFRPEAIDMEALVEIGIGVRDRRHHPQR